MNKEQKEAWLKEAEMQMKAIRTLEKYNMAALAVAGLGAAFCYFNFRAADRNLLLICCQNSGCRRRKNPGNACCRQSRCVQTKNRLCGCGGTEAER